MRRILAPAREENQMFWSKWTKCSVSSVCGVRAVEMASPGTPHAGEMSHKSNLYAQNVTPTLKSVRMLRETGKVGIQTIHLKL